MGSRAMCADDDCPVRARCYRHPDSGAEPGWNQAWSAFRYTGPEGCENFVEKWRSAPQEPADDGARERRG